MSARQTLDHGSRNPVGHSKGVHRHHRSDDTPPKRRNIGRDSSPCAERSDAVLISPHSCHLLSAYQKATAYGLVLVLKAVVGLLGAGAQGHGMDR